MNTELETLKVWQDGGVTTVQLNRPPVNAVNTLMMEELSNVFASLEERRDVGAVVLAAAGDRAFCAGIDLNETRSGTTEDVSRALPVREQLDPGYKWRRTQHLIRHLPVPVVAAVEGPAIGAGFGLVGVSDVVVASERARFGLTEINVGMLGGASKALRMLGPFKARMLFFSGELVDATEFYRLGVVEDVVATGSAYARAMEIATTFASKSPIGLRLAKESLLRIEGGNLEEDYRTEQDYTIRLRGLSDSDEAMSAYLEKRTPEWSWS